MEIEQYNSSEQNFSSRMPQIFNYDSCRDTRNQSQQDNSIDYLIDYLQSHLQGQKQIRQQESVQSGESQSQILLRNMMDSFNNSRKQNCLNLNFYQFDIQSHLMEKIILSIGQLSHLNSIHINISRQNWGQDEVQALCNQLLNNRQLKELDINLGLNCVSDKGHEILTETLSNLEMLQIIKINFEKNRLQRRSISMLEIFNKLTQIQQFSLNLNGNSIDIDDEMKLLLPKFKSENIFANVKSFEIMFNEYNAKFNGNQQDENNGSNQNNINQMNGGQNQALQQQQMQIIQQTIMQHQQQLQQLHAYSQQMLQRGYPQNHPQYLQVVAQMQQIQITIQQNLQVSKNLASKSTTIKKKSVISRLLEIMLKFTNNLEEFSFACPGQLIDSVCWEQFAELIKIRSQKLRKFHFSGLNSNTKNQDMEYFFYQMAKLVNLTNLSLSLHNLSTQNGLFLERFLKPLTKLEIVHIDLSSPDNFSNQKEIFRDLCNFINNTESQNICEIDLNISNSQIDNEAALSLFQGIAKMSKLSTIKLNMQSCQQIDDKAIDYLCQSLLYQKCVKSLNINAAQSNITPQSIQNMMQTLLQLKENLIQLQLNLTNRGEGFTNFNNQIINDTISQLTNLKKCVVSSIRNPKIRLYREKAEEVNKIIKACQQVKNSNALKGLRKEIAFEALQFLI